MTAKKCIVAGALLYILLLAAWLSGASAQQDPLNMVSYEEKFITGAKKYALEKWSDAIIYIR